MKKITTLFIAALCCVGTYAQQIKTKPTCTLVVSTDSVFNVRCNGSSDGSAQVIVKGGTSPYTYVWSPGGITNQTATGLSAGTYTVTVVDKNGCTGTATVTITQPTALTATAMATGEPCNGDASGTATTVVGGGTPAYKYSWAPLGSTSSKATGLTAGTYTVTITDANGCTTTATATVTQPAALSLSTSYTKPSCDSCCNGSASATVSGGTAPYSYSWSNGATDASITGLCNGSYTCCVTDKNGCTTCDTVKITRVNNINGVAINYTIYPNPGNGHFTLNLSVTNPQPYTIEIYNMLGQTLSTETINPAAGVITKEMDISAYGKGLYFIAVKCSSGMAMKKIIVM